MSIAPPSGGEGGGGAADLPGEWFVDVNAPSGGDGSSGAPLNDLQAAISVARIGGVIKVINVLPGTYLTRFDAALDPVSAGGFEIDHMVVRSTHGKEVTFLVGDTGIGFNVVIMREDALLEGFTITPEIGRTCIAFADSGGGPPPHPLFGSHSIVRDVTFDAEPLSPSMGGACFSTFPISGSATDNILENFEVKGEWDSGLGFVDPPAGGGVSQFYLRDGVIDPDCRFDFSFLWVGSSFGGGGTGHLYVENLHVPASVTITDDAFVAAGDGVLHLANVSVDGAGARGLSADHYAFAAADGIILGDGIRIVNSVGFDLEIAEGAVIEAPGYLPGIGKFAYDKGASADLARREFFDRVAADEGRWTPDLSVASGDPISDGILIGSTWTYDSMFQFMFDSGVEAFLRTGNLIGDICGGIGPALQPVLGTHHWRVALRSRPQPISDIGVNRRPFVGVTSKTTLAALFGSADPGVSHIGLIHDGTTWFWSWTDAVHQTVSTGVSVGSTVNIPLRVEIDWRHAVNAWGREFTVRLFAEVDVVAGRFHDELLDARTIASIHVPVANVMRPAIGVESLTASGKDFGVLTSAVRNDRQYAISPR